jgi:hypothetical protein
VIVYMQMLVSFIRSSTLMPGSRASPRRQAKWQRAQATGCLAPAIAEPTLFRGRPSFQKPTPPKCSFISHVAVRDLFSRVIVGVSPRLLASFRCFGVDRCSRAAATQREHQVKRRAAF